MTIAEAIYQHLTADAALTALVGTRIYSVVAPTTATYPLIRYTQVSGSRLGVLNGSRLKMPLIQFDVYAAQTSMAATGHTAVDAHVTQARAVAEALETAMQSFDGAIGGVRVTLTYIDNDLELFEDDGALARVTQSYRVWWDAA